MGRGVDRAAGTDRSGGYAIGAGSAEPGGDRAPTPGLAYLAWALVRDGAYTAHELTNIVAFVDLAATYSFTVAYGYVEARGLRLATSLA